MIKMKYKWFVSYAFMKKETDDRVSIGSCFINSDNNRLSEKSIRELSGIIETREYFHKVSIINLILLENE